MTQFLFEAMFRSITALLISILAHLLVLLSITFPTHGKTIPDVIRISMALPEHNRMIENAQTIIEQSIESEIQIPDAYKTPSTENLQDFSQQVSFDNSTESDTFEESYSDEIVSGAQFQAPVNSSLGDADDMSTDSAIEIIADEVISETIYPTDTLNESDSVNNADRDRILNEYRQIVLRMISAHKQYPSVARRMSQEGNVGVRFRVSPEGVISIVELEVSSGYESLDRAALDAVRAASPVAPVPGELGQDGLTLTITLIFVLD